MNLFSSIISLLFIFLFSFKSLAQDKLNQYGYLVIPEQFTFQSSPNEYDINKVLKKSFNKYNFKAFIERDTIPTNIKRCDVLNIEVDKSGVFSTKIKLIFRDCYKNIVYTSSEGKSKIKEFKQSYYQAFGQALKDPNISKHQFKPNKHNTKAISKIVFSLVFKTIKYDFLETNIKEEYQILKNKKLIGTLKRTPNTNAYMMEAGTLSGTGTFDDFGNFTLSRINPVNKTTIVDIMARVE